MSTAVATRPDTQDMVVIHNVFRRNFAALPTAVRAVPDGDTERAARVVAFVDEMTVALHHHHSGEDELMWPRLLDRVPTDRALVLRMEEQHERIGELVARVESQAREFAAVASPESGAHLAETLTALTGALDEHLAEEEARILPLVEQVMSAAEWAELGDRGRESIPEERRLVFLGFMLHGATDQQRRAILSEVPLPGRLAWRLLGRRAFAREYRGIYGVAPA